jgi:hypothetical protein
MFGAPWSQAAHKSAVMLLHWDEHGNMWSAATRRRFVYLGISARVEVFVFMNSNAQDVNR